jgi:hypothetical protein
MEWHPTSGNGRKMSAIVAVRYSRGVLPLPAISCGVIRDPNPLYGSSRVFVRIIAFVGSALAVADGFYL